jgi:hypothetical protein
MRRTDTPLLDIYHPPGESKMRFAMLLLVGACLAAPLAVNSAQGVTLRPPGIEAGSSGIDEAAARRCGRGYHWVTGHKARNGHWIKGHCVRNRRR